MIGLILVAHARLGTEMLRAAEMIVGPLERVAAIPVLPDDSAEKIREQIDAAIREVGDGGVIIMTDMFGGTPSNIALSFLEAGRIEVLTGMNLPMIIQFGLERKSHGIAELATRLSASGRDAISVAGDFLRS